MVLYGHVELRGDIVFRKSMDYLVNWKNSKDRKPLIIRGARQVGKTWLMKEFGTTNYEQYAYINFDNNESVESLFNYKRKYCQNYQPKYAIRTSMSDYRHEEWLTNVPLYAINVLSNILKENNN